VVYTACDPQIIIPFFLLCDCVIAPVVADFSKDQSVFMIRVKQPKKN